MDRLVLAFRAFWALLTNGKLPEDLLGKLNLVPRGAARPQQAAKPEPPAVRVSDGALQLLGILQRDSRLVDFLMEDLSGYEDEQIGAAVRSMHESAKKSLLQHVSLNPAIDGVEGAYTKVGDASVVKFIGNVPADGKAPGGILRHRGWKAESITLPVLTAKANVAVLAPAEIEVE